MSEKEKQVDAPDTEASVEERITEIIQKSADAIKAEGKVDMPSVDDIVAKVKAEMEGEQVTMSQVKEMLDEYMKTKEEDKPEEKEADKPEEEKADEKADEKETKPGDHAYAEKVSDLQGEVKSLKDSLGKLTKSMDAEKDRVRKASQKTELHYKQGEFRVDRFPEAPNAAMWKEVPTRAGMCEKMGVELVKTSNTLDTKASTYATTLVAGHPIVGTPVWRTLVDRVRIWNLLRPMTIAKGGKFKLVNITDAAYAMRTVIDPAVNPAAGAIDETETTINEFAATVPIAFSVEEDNDGVASQVEQGFLQKYGERLDNSAFAALKGGVDTDMKVKTGTANQLPAADILWNKLMELRKTVDLAYRDNGVFLINTDIEDILMQNYRAGSGFAFNPFDQKEITQILGAPVVVSNRLDDTSTAADGEVCAMFGDFTEAGVAAERISLQIWVDQNRPGYRVYQARGRHAAAVRATAAYAVLEVGS